MESKNDKENKKNEERKKIIFSSQTLSEALLELIFADITERAENFLNQSEEVFKITEEYFLATKDDKEKLRKDWKEAVKLWLDHALAASQMLKYFLVKESKVKGEPLDATISQALETILRSDDAQWFNWYDAIRNYLTKKPQDDAKENKLKLNFENGSLLGGWSDGQEKNKAAVLLRKDGLYYLGILKKKNLFNTEKEDNKVYKNITPNAERLILANLKFQTLAGKGFLGEFGQAYGSMGKENPQKSIQCLQKIIKDRYVKKQPLLERIASASYADKKAFDKDIQETLKECYVCEFRLISWDEVEKYSDIGDMYLFQIYNKDFSEKNTGKKDLQTLYWNTVFEKNSPFQLNGGGEIFYRKQAIQGKDKKTKKGYEGKKDKKDGKEFIIENKRFTAEKFLFHCPIKINYKAKSYSDSKYAIPEINKLANKHLFINLNAHFLGIDRGEKHLAYYSLVDQNGKIIDQDTLNMPFVDKDGNQRTVKTEKRTMKDEKERVEIVECKNYNELLEARAGDRNYARKNWQTIGTIKELKDGYISQVVRKIADLSVRHNAFIVLEDLNTGFKRSRQKIEKSVYQKLELALAKKLNFLVDKTKKNGEIGSVTNALQLTPPVSNYGDIENRKQMGIMLYTRANYTSQTDPVTGWRKSIYLKTGSEESIKDQIIGNEEKKIPPSFSEIGFNGKDYFFVYTDESTGKKWTLYSGKDGESLDRFRGRKKDKNEWKIEKHNVAQILNGVFASFDKNRSILSQIIEEGAELSKISEHTAWESLRFAIDLIQQMRNTGESDQDNDFLFSPVRNEKGTHFDSRKATKEEPASGDANGAYNIARKGIIMKEHIKRGYKLFIFDAEWDAWLVGKETWEEWVKNNAELLKWKNNKI